MLEQGFHITDEIRKLVQMAKDMPKATIITDYSADNFFSGNEMLKNALLLTFQDFFLEKTNEHRCLKVVEFFLESGVNLSEKNINFCFRLKSSEKKIAQAKELLKKYNQPKEEPQKPQDRVAMLVAQRKSDAEREVADVCHRVRFLVQQKNGPDFLREIKILLNKYKS